MSGRATEGEKTAVRAVRFSKRLERTLAAEAKIRDVSVNALITSILTRWEEWGRHTEQFGFISVSQDFVKCLLENCGAEKLQELAVKQAPMMVKENILYWFKELNLKSFLAWITLFYKYSGGGLCELSRDERGETTLTIKTEMGEEWATFQATLLKELMSELFQIAPEAYQVNGSVVIKFSISEPNDQITNPG